MAAWMLQCMSERGEVTVLSRVPFDPVEVDHHYGTSLSGLLISNPRAVHPLIEQAAGHGAPVALARMHYVMRVAKKMASEFDLLCSANNEQDFGVPSIDYVHYPWNSYPRPDAPAHWEHNPLLRAVLRLYNRGCCLISGFSGSRPQNLTLVNSSWTLAKYREVYPNRPARVLFPPALAEPLDDYSARRPRFLSIGRVSRSKDWGKLIDIVAGVRARGHDVGLTLAGSRDDRGYEEEIARKLQSTGLWAEMRLDLSRQELQELLRTHEFGLHGMEDEHFGMAVAELILGGCLTVVPDSGGQVEIVRDPSLRYESVEDAVSKIDRILSSHQLKKDLHQAQQTDRLRYTKEAFQESFGAILNQALERGVQSLVGNA